MLVCKEAGPGLGIGIEKDNTQADEFGANLCTPTLDIVVLSEYSVHLSLKQWQLRKVEMRLRWWTL